MLQKQFNHIKNINQSDIQQLVICTVRLRHKDRYATCRSFVVPRDCPSLLGIPDIELLNIVKIMCEVIGDPHESQKFDLQAIGVSKSPSCRRSRVPQNKTDKVDVNDTNAIMPDYFRSAPTKLQTKE